MRLIAINCLTALVKTFLNLFNLHISQFLTFS